MRSPLHIFLASLVLLTFAGCSGNDGKFVIGVSQCSQDEWRTAVNNEIRREAAIKGDMDVIFRSVSDDSEKQADDIRDMIRKKVDLLVIAPNESAPLADVVGEAYRSGIPVILFDRKIESEEYSTYIGADNQALAYELGRYLAFQIGYSGNVVILRGTEGSTADAERYAGFSSAISNYPDINVIAQRFCNFTEGDAMKGMHEIVDSLKDTAVDAIFAMNDRMAVGASLIYSNLGRLRPFIVGIDALEGSGGGIESIANGTIDASFIYPTGGGAVVDVAHKILSHQPFERSYKLHTALVDKTNINTIQLESAKISDLDRKADELYARLGDSQAILGRQKLMMEILVILLLAVAGFAVVIMRLNRAISRLNSRLKERNAQLSEMSDELEKATHAKLVFFTDVSHELKTPLTLIEAPIKELAESSNLTDQQRKNLEIVQRNTSKLKTMVSQILEFRTYENGMMRLNYTVQSLRDCIMEVNSLVGGNILGNRQVRFSMDAPDSVVFAFDKVKVEEIYLNLLSNAMKHVHQGGEIRVSLGKKDNAAEFSVFNSGSYIPEDKREAVFGRFYHMDPDADSTGIGLALVKGLVELHGGSVTVESSKDSGTSFIVRLPLLQAVPAAADAGGTKKTDEIAEQANQLRNNVSEEDEDIDMLIGGEDGNVPKVLVVDDNRDMRIFLRNTLGKEFDVSLASEGTEGLKKAIQEVPDVCVSDLMMPGMDGYEFCNALKDNPVTKDIPVILLSVVSSDESRERAYELGVDSYMTKPFDADVLRMRVRELVAKRRVAVKSHGDDDLAILNKDGVTVGEKQKQFFSEMCAYIEKHLNDNITVTELAKQMGLSRSAFYRYIGNVTTWTPNDIVNIVRLRYSVRLILQSGKKVSEAAYETGFSSPSYYSKIFKQYYGVSPQEYIDKRLK